MTANTQTEKSLSNRTWREEKRLMDWGQEAGSSGSSSFLSPVHRRQEHTSSRVAMWGRLKIQKDGTGAGRGKAAAVVWGERWTLLAGAASSHGFGSPSPGLAGVHLTWTRVARGLWPCCSWRPSEPAARVCCRPPHPSSLFKK